MGVGDDRAHDAPRAVIRLEALDLDASPLLHLARVDRRAREQVLRNHLGGFGFPGDMALSRVLESFKVEKAEEAQGTIEVRRGGPVEGNRGYLMHSDDFNAHGAICRDDGVAVSASTDVLRAMAAGRGPERAILFLGYAGWAPGQLDEEVAQGGWVVVQSDAGMLLDRDVTGLWRRAMMRRGIDL